MDKSRHVFGSIVADRPFWTLCDKDSARHRVSPRPRRGRLEAEQGATVRKTMIGVPPYQTNFVNEVALVALDQ
jgi:hypothetical protein